MSFPVELAPQPSRLMMAGLVAGYLALGLTFLASSLPGWAIVVAWLGLALGAVGSLRRWCHAARIRFVLGQSGSIRVMPPGGAAYEAQACPGCRDLGWAVWLAWCATPENGRRSRQCIVMLPRDALAPEAWRALRVWLRFHSDVPAPGGDA